MKNPIDTKTSLEILRYLKAKGFIGYYEPEAKVIRRARRFMDEVSK